MIEILAVLGVPVAGALVLATIGHRDQAAMVNVCVCLATFLSAVALTVLVQFLFVFLVFPLLFAIALIPLGLELLLHHLGWLRWVPSSRTAPL